MNTRKKYFEFKKKQAQRTSSYVGLSDDIALSILNVLKEKKISKKEFASKLGKQPSIISKWFNGQHNFTVKTIVDIDQKILKYFKHLFIHYTPNLYSNWN